MKLCHLEPVQGDREEEEQEEELLVDKFFLHLSLIFCYQTKVGGTSSGGSFEEVLSSAANASSQDTPTNNLPDEPERPC